jgi:hypothetical protein
MIAVLTLAMLAVSVLMLITGWHDLAWAMMPLAALNWLCLEKRDRDARRAAEDRDPSDQDGQP